MARSKVLLASPSTGSYSCISITPTRRYLRIPSSAKRWSRRAGRSRPTEWRLCCEQGRRPNHDRALDRQGRDPRQRPDLETTLRRIGEVRYHNLHPFHKLLHGGKLNKGQVQAWALNRYYYQSTIPIKDAVVISRFRDRNTRMEWRHRIEDHDGDAGKEG